jgi:hypothetical protein
MLDRVAVNRDKEEFVDLLIDYVPENDPAWRDALELTARPGAIRLRLRLHADELNVLAVALDAAMTGGDGELYYRGSSAAG